MPEAHQEQECQNEYGYSHAKNVIPNPACNHENSTGKIRKQFGDVDRIYFLDPEAGGVWLKKRKDAKWIVPNSLFLPSDQVEFEVFRSNNHSLR